MGNGQGIPPPRVLCRQHRQPGLDPAGTVEGLFAIAGENLANADKVEIAYDATYGFPVSIVVDRIEMAMDDEISYYVENFEILE